MPGWLSSMGIPSFLVRDPLNEGPFLPAWHKFFSIFRRMLTADAEDAWSIRRHLTTLSHPRLF